MVQTNESYLLQMAPQPLDHVWGIIKNNDFALLKTGRYAAFHFIDSIRVILENRDLR